ncbi:hypothetical protein P4E94_19425, partial [Pontiellaceae bacterium B12219]|nr:hypothetical protein [Pontiellaceae bacterium B12219]
MKDQRKVWRLLLFQKRCRSAVLVSAVGGLLSLIFPLRVFSASELVFDAAAQPTSLVLGDADFFDNDAADGFYLYHFDGEEVTTTKLSTLSASDDEITISNPDGDETFTFSVEAYDHHLAIHLMDMEGIGTGRSYALSLILSAASNVCAYTLNDMMTASDGTTITLKWPYLWGRERPNGTHGSVVLYDDSLEGNERDEVLAEIWSTQGTAGHMVTPAVNSWTESDVMAWVDAWAEKFARVATVNLAPENEIELYEMTDALVFSNNANRVFMFSTVWRGEYHLYTLSLYDVNTNIFPNGKSDLIAYSDYLAEQGVHLQLKSLSPSIAASNERYVSSTAVDHRFSCWGRGTLAEAIDSYATTIKFRRGT